MKAPRAQNRIRELLKRNGVPYGFHESTSSMARRLSERYGVDLERVPVVFLLDGSALANPTDAAIMDAIGEITTSYFATLRSSAADPQGLQLAVYAGSEGLRTLVMERHVIGGQAGASSRIRNYLGFPRGISGAELTQRAYQQAWLFGAKIRLRPRGHAHRCR